MGVGGPLLPPGWAEADLGKTDGLGMTTAALGAEAERAGIAPRETGRTSSLEVSSSTIRVLSL